MVTSAVVPSHYSSHHFAGSHRSPLPPISGGAVPGLGAVSKCAQVEGGKQTSPFLHSLQPAYSREFCSPQCASSKRTPRRHSSEKGVSDPQSLRERLSKAVEQAEQARVERDEMAKVAGQAQEAASAERARAARLEERVSDLQSFIDNLQQQLEGQAFICKRMEADHKRSTEKLVAKFRREAEERQAAHQAEMNSVKEQLEEVVLKAAIDLNRQHRDLSSEQLKAVRSRRRATDGGGIPLLGELQIKVRASGSKIGTPEKPACTKVMAPCSASPEHDFAYSPDASDEPDLSHVSKGSTPMKREASQTWHRGSDSSSGAMEASRDLAGAGLPVQKTTKSEKPTPVRSRVKTPRNCM